MKIGLICIFVILMFRGLTVFAGRALRNALYGKQRNSTRDQKFRVAKS